MIDKLYSRTAIMTGTLLGGPLAAGLLLRRNFLNLDDEKSALFSWFTGAVITLALLTGIYLVPLNVLDRIPTPVAFPLIYMSITYLIMQNTMGKAIEAQKNKPEGYYSIWRSAGLGLICALIYLGAAIGIGFYKINNDPATAAFEDMKVLFSANEEKALLLNELLDQEKYDQIPQFVTDTGIPLWQENLNLLGAFKYASDPDELYASEIEHYQKYCLLRIQQFDLYRKLVVTETPADSEKLENINDELAKLLD